jgi:hypothetical protein
MLYLFFQKNIILGGKILKDYCFSFLLFYIPQSIDQMKDVPLSKSVKDDFHEERSCLKVQKWNQSKLFSIPQST